MIEPIATVKVPGRGFYLVYKRDSELCRMAISRDQNIKWKTWIFLRRKEAS